MNKDTDTNFGWWAEKPEREGRPSSWQPSGFQPVRRRTQSVWRQSALMVGSVLAFVLSMIYLANR
jgi:hypothetical protein